MKNKLILLSALLFAALCVSAQNTSLEENLAKIRKDSTQMEKFINECDFYTSECFFRSNNSDKYCGGLYIEGIVYRDLVENKKIGGLKIWTDNKQDVYLGYLDFDEMDDLIVALRKMIDEASAKHYGEKGKSTYQIYYITRGGIDVVGSLDFNYFTVVLSKKWSYLNSTGNWEWVRVTSNERPLKEISKLIQGIEKAKEIIAKELENPN